MTIFNLAKLFTFTINVSYKNIIHLIQNQKNSIEKITDYKIKLYIIKVLIDSNRPSIYLQIKTLIN